MPGEGHTRVWYQSSHLILGKEEMKSSIFVYLPKCQTITLKVIFKLLCFTLTAPVYLDKIHIHIHYSHSSFSSCNAAFHSSATTAVYCGVNNIFIAIWSQKTEMKICSRLMPRG